MAMKISDALIGLVIVGGMVTLFVMIMADGANTFSTSVDTAAYNQFNSTLNDVTTMANAQAASSQNLTAISGLDWLGGLFTSAWSSIKLTAASAGLFNDLISFGLSNIGLSEAQIAILYTVFVAIVLITITFIILRIILKEQI
jgi:hypothetical protein